MRMERKLAPPAPAQLAAGAGAGASGVAPPAPFSAQRYEDDSDTTTAVTAADLVNSLPEAELARLISDYGEERLAGRVARAIVQRRATQPFARTLDLADVVASTLRAAAAAGGGPALGLGHPATRTFMALRIAVNGELRQLQRLLAHAPQMLAVGANLAVISFHSLEDRMVKRAFAALAAPAQATQAQGAQRVQGSARATSASARGIPSVAPLPSPGSFVFTASPDCITASPAEVAANPRARSAKMRVLTRVA
jgi:16S rRNA (cytosine1402-N4)-methyltransferase